MAVQNNGGYTSMFKAAVANGTDKIEGDSLLARFESLKKKEDPQQRMRNRCAAELLEAATRSIGDGHPTATRKALLVDVGSAVGRDAGAWRAQADAAGLGADRLDIVGVELLAPLVQKATAEHPGCRFLQGDVAALPLESATVDGVHCSRLLIHAPDCGKAIDEMVRVLRPGGYGVFEEGDFACNTFLSGDARATAVFRASNDAMIAKLANPHAARVAHTLLRARDDVENVVIESDSYCLLDYETIDPGLVYLPKQLDPLVKAGTITEADAVHYTECVKNAPRVGEPVQAHVMFKISFTKKKLASAPAN